MKTKLLDIVRDLALSWWARKGNSIDNLTEDEMSNIVIEYHEKSKGLKVRVRFIK